MSIIKDVLCATNILLDPLVIIIFCLKSCIISEDNFLVPDYPLDIIAFIGIKDEQDIEFEEVTCTSIWFYSQML